VSEGAVRLLALGGYRNESPYPFCPGCGHGGILDQLNRALVSLRMDPSRTVIVSDIGCSGLSDQYFRTGAFHGLHGRSVAYASGIKLARPDLHVIVVMGDGGCGIGGTHLINAARRNVGITVLVFNNLNFGMTGGQHSVTTPTGAVTATTPGGNLEHPLDVCGTVAVNGAGWAYRATTFDEDLSERIAEALAFDGFALLDIWETCTAYYAPANRLSRAELDRTLERAGFARGQVGRTRRPEYARALREAAAALPAAQRPEPLAPRYESRLGGRYRLVLAGSAGGRVRSAAHLGATAGILSGLWATQRDDYPVTVKTGHSVSELILSPEPFEYTGIRRPDALVLVTPEGAARSSGRLAALGPEARLYAPSDLAGTESRSRARRLELGRVPAASRALALLAAALVEAGAVSADALEAAVRTVAPGHVEESLRAIRAGLTALG